MKEFTLGERLSLLLTRHPKVIRAATLGLVGLAMANLVGAIELDLRGRELIGRIQREASEQLGG